MASSPFWRSHLQLCFLSYFAYSVAITSTKTMGSFANMLTLFLWEPLLWRLPFYWLLCADSQWVVFAGVLLRCCLVWCCSQFGSYLAFYLWVRIVFCALSNNKDSRSIAMPILCQALPLLIFLKVMYKTSTKYLYPRLTNGCAQSNAPATISIKRLGKMRFPNPTLLPRVVPGLHLTPTTLMVPCNSISSMLHRQMQLIT